MGVSSEEGNSVRGGVGAKRGSRVAVVDFHDICIEVSRHGGKFLCFILLRNTLWKV